MKRQMLSIVIVTLTILSLIGLAMYGLADAQAKQKNDMEKNRDKLKAAMTATECRDSLTRELCYDIYSREFKGDTLNMFVAQCMSDIYAKDKKGNYYNPMHVSEINVVCDEAAGKAIDVNKSIERIAKVINEKVKTEDVSKADKTA